VDEIAGDRIVKIASRAMKLESSSWRHGHLNAAAGRDPFWSRNSTRPERVFAQRSSSTGQLYLDACALRAHPQFALDGQEAASSTRRRERVRAGFDEFSPPPSASSPASQGWRSCGSPSRRGGSPREVALEQRGRFEPTGLRAGTALRRRPGAGDGHPEARAGVSGARAEELAEKSRVRATLPPSIAAGSGRAHVLSLRAEGWFRKARFAALENRHGQRSCHRHPPADSADWIPPGSGSLPRWLGPPGRNRGACDLRPQPFAMAPNARALAPNELLDLISTRGTMQRLGSPAVAVVSKTTGSLAIGRPCN